MSLFIYILYTNIYIAYLSSYVNVGDPLKRRLRSRILPRFWSRLSVPPSTEATDLNSDGQLCVRAAADRLIGQTSPTSLDTVTHVSCHMPWAIYHDINMYVGLCGIIDSLCGRIYEVPFKWLPRKRRKKHINLQTLKELEGSQRWAIINIICIPRSCPLAIRAVLTVKNDRAYKKIKEK